MSISQLSEDWYHTDMALPIPTSVTHELLESGRRKRQTTFGTKGARMQVNFQSYDFKDFRLDVGQKNVKLYKKIKDHVTTTYCHDYKAPYPLICQPTKPVDTDVDPTFNRRPINYFKLVPCAPGKFMDDHLTKSTVARKRNNFFRQLRQAHFHY